MKVQEVMTTDVETCMRDTNLAAAAMIMWRRDCGVVPVTTPDRKVTGVITDRDICMAVATQHRPAESILVGEIVDDTIHSVRPQDDLNRAIELMRSQRIRRIPVTKPDGTIAGMLSVNDLILASGSSRTGGVTTDQIMSLLRTVCEHNHEHAHA